VRRYATAPSGITANTILRIVAATAAPDRSQRLFDDTTVLG